MKHLTFFTLFAVLQNCIFAQTWNLPARNANAMSGTQFVSAITSLSFTARENLIKQEILNGNIPSFYRNLKPVTSTATISGVSRSITYYVTPDYLAVGSDSNYFLCPMSPMIATYIADATGCTLPTRKMVNDIYASATVKLTPQTIPASGQMTTVPVFSQHNDMVYTQRTNATWVTHTFGELTGGDKKDIVISNLISSTTNKVIIYGWHQSVGNPIQPMSSVHADTYMDYSHGIRLVQNAVVYNGTNTTVKTILQSSTLNTLLSDEGVIANPQYPYSSTITNLSTPISWAVKNNGNNTLSILISNDANATHYKVYTSNDGVNFNAPQIIVKTNLILNSLAANKICFIKIAAYNQPNNITSTTSTEILAGVPTLWQDSVLLIQGFDRASSGNTYNFLIQHGTALKQNGYNFSSCTNEAIQNNLISLQSYKAVDWILGEESTADETFNSTEQIKVSGYLEQGGNLFVSGSEIGWDLDYSGSSADKQFYNNYLKASYLMDAPNNTANSCYTVYSETDTLNFDNGTHGTYNVDYPDVIKPLNGATSTIYYCNDTSQKANTIYSGTFGSGNSNAKLVYWAYPFETLYPQAKQVIEMKNIMDYFFNFSTFFYPNDYQNRTLGSIIIFPNPAKNKITIEGLSSTFCLNIYNLNGQLIKTQKVQDYKTIDISMLQPGIYFFECGNEKGMKRIKVAVE